MPNPNAIRPLSEQPLMTEGLVGDVPVGYIVLQKDEKKTLQFLAKIFSKLSFDLVLEVPEGAELMLEGAFELAPGADVEQLVMIRGAGKVTLRQVANVERDARLMKRIVIDGRDGAVCIIDDATYLRGPCAKAEMVCRGVLRDAARSTVRGRIVIERGASGASADMQLHHLLLGERAYAAAVPELSVHVDDVTCRHAASITRPNDAALAYLASRGLASDAASDMLAEAFLCPVVV
ncbi:MAG: SufD family Fe-S cluster assembly protein [Candidatus Uhrbacteria bacterium]|nr:SufD family Fe-S cluster assembly protein [Candidatus Uhrbacteria bacterium]